MFKPKGRAHSNVFIHLHKYHLSRRRQLLKQRKFTGSLHASQSAGAQLWFHEAGTFFKCQKSTLSTVGGAGERRLSFHVIHQRDE